jgi:hypothetical protein
MATKTFQYKVLEAVEIDGEEVAVGEVVELTTKAAKELGEKVEKVEEDGDKSFSVEFEGGQVRTYPTLEQAEEFAGKRPDVRKVIK